MLSDSYVRKRILECIKHLEEEIEENNAVIAFLKRKLDSYGNESNLSSESEENG